MDGYKPSKEELAIINERFAKEPYGLPDQLYAFPAMIIDNKLTAYFTRVHPTFLEQCVKDLFNGVGFLVGHDTTKLPMARSFKGHLISDGDAMEVFAKFFMQKDLEINGINTDDFMKAFLGGTIEDVSIGFAAKRYECSICHLDIRSSDCPHWLGKKYNDKNEEDEKGNLCFAWVMEPSGPSGEALLEVSAVYKGAVPEAKQKKVSDIPKFIINLTEGKSLKEMPMEEAIAMNFNFPEIISRGGENVFDINKFFAGEYSKEELGEIELSVEDIDAILEHHRSALENGRQEADFVKLEEEIQTVQANNKILLEQNTEFTSQINQLKTEIETIKQVNIQLQKEIEELKPKAKDGEKYRDDLINETLELGIKLEGNNFDKANYEKLLKEPARTIDDIKKMRNQFLKELCERFPGSRQTTSPPLGLPGDNSQRNSGVPDEAFKI